MHDAGRALLVPKLAEAIPSSGNGQMERAVALLAWVGGPALPVLEKLAFESPEPRTRVVAARAMASAAPSEYRAALARAAAAARGLSAAEPPTAPADRGLSVPDDRHA